MIFTTEMMQAISDSVLCWLATADKDGHPSVSPKQVFCAKEPNRILIANIASPGSIRNLKTNAKVCISVLDIFRQKGYKFKGEAELITSKSSGFEGYHATLKPIVGNRFQIISVLDCTIRSAKPILAPSYLFYEDTTEQDQIEAAMRDYNVKPK